MKFSIITITRNHLHGLQATARSLSIQDYRDFEWIVIDGDSNDGTRDILPSLNAISISEPDHGIYDAMNKGIDRASGEYVLFLNAGDTLAGADVLGRIAGLEGDFIYGDSIESGHIKPARPHHKILYGMFTHHQAMFYRRGRLGALRYDTRHKIAADYRLTLLFLQQAEMAAHYAPFPVCVFEPGGVSQQQAWRGRVEQFRIRQSIRACGMLRNILIFCAQSAAYGVRRAWPGGYWRVKKTTGYFRRFRQYQ